MSTTVTFAGHLANDPELTYTREGGTPFVSFRVMVKPPLPERPGGGRRTSPPRTTSASTAARPPTWLDSFCSGNGVTVHGLLTRVAWTDKETDEKRTKRIVAVNDYLGSVGAWVNRWTAVRSKKRR